MNTEARNQVQRARHSDPARVPRRVLVVGLGNILLGDDGLGVRAVEALQRRWRLADAVTTLDGGTGGLDLLEWFRGQDLVIVIDALRLGRSPGTVSRLAGEEIPAWFRTLVSRHQLGLPELLATLQLLGEAPREVVVIGIEPAATAPPLVLSAVVAAQLGTVVELVVMELERAGLPSTSVPPRARRRSLVDPASSPNGGLFSAAVT